MAAQARAALRAGTVSSLMAGHSGPQPGGLWLGSVALACSADGSSRLTRRRISNRKLLSSLPEKRAKNSFINMIGSLPKKVLVWVGWHARRGGGGARASPRRGGGGAPRDGRAPKGRRPARAGGGRGTPGGGSGGPARRGGPA